MRTSIMGRQRRPVGGRKAIYACAYDQPPDPDGDRRPVHAQRDELVAAPDGATSDSEGRAWWCLLGDSSLASFSVDG